MGRAVSDVRDVAVVFSVVSCAFKHFLLGLFRSDGLDEVDEFLFPCFPDCKWKKSASMCVN